MNVTKKYSQLKFQHTEASTWGFKYIVVETLFFALFYDDSFSDSMYLQVMHIGNQEAILG